MICGFTHKVWKVREEILKCLQRALSEYATFLCTFFTVSVSVSGLMS